MSAEDYAREILGMADDEPNGATGFEMAQAFLDMTTAFEAGRREGAETGWDECSKTFQATYGQPPFWAANPFRALPVEVTE